jgi:hypothetical protein
MAAQIFAGEMVNPVDHAPDGLHRSAVQLLGSADAIERRPIVVVGREIHARRPQHARCHRGEQAEMGAQRGKER